MPARILEENEYLPPLASGAAQQTLPRPPTQRPTIPHQGQRTPGFPYPSAYTGHWDLFWGWLFKNPSVPQVTGKRLIIPKNTEGLVSGHQPPDSRAKHLLLFLSGAGENPDVLTLLWDGSKGDLGYTRVGPH